MRLRLCKILFLCTTLILNCASAKESKVVNNSSLSYLTVPTYTGNGELDSKLKDLTNQIINSLTETKKSKIAVIEFSDLKGNITDFGRYLSEELITRLFITQKFEVVERQLLNKVLEEHKLNTSGLIDENSIKQLGRILGVDAIASGSIADLGGSVKVNARLISTETGRLFAVAALEVHKDETIKKLMSSMVSSGPEDKILAKLVKVRNDERRQHKFSINQDRRVRIYALGEGAPRSYRKPETMYDYGWIERVDYHKVVWKMEYAKTKHAGGAKKNRLFDDIVLLEKGDYIVYYESDDSHCFEDWNAEAPYDPGSWGITVYLVRE